MSGAAGPAGAGGLAGKGGAAGPAGAGGLAGKGGALAPGRIAGLLAYLSEKASALALPVVIERMRDGLVVLDRAGRVAQVNPAAAQIPGGLATGAPGRPATVVLAGYPELLPHLAATEPVALEVAAGEGNGRRYYDLSITPLYQPSGELAGRALLWHDITERKQRAADLERAWRAAEAAAKAKSAFLSQMSHDLRTPLNAIIGYSEMLLEEAQDRGWYDVVPDLQKIRAAGQHLLAVLSDILDLARIEAGRMSRFVETFAVAPLVDEVVAAVGPVAAAYGNELRVSGAGEAGTVRQDRAKVRQILFNVLHNACKFTDRGLVTLTVARAAGAAGEWLTLRVADTGPGLTPAEMERLFTPLTDAGPFRQRRRGNGLGLALSQRLCHVLAGQITAESRPGQGATFTVRLPAELEPAHAPVVAAGAADVPAGAAAAPATAPGPGAVSASTAAGAPAAAPGPTLLVIDDDPTAHDLIRRIAGGAGYRLAHAESGLAGLRLARELRPDLITCDVMMPELDGWATLAALKADPDLSGIPVIMMTSLDDRSLGLKLGAADFVTKPITRERLIRALARLPPARRRAEPSHR